jgi:hypothetical protein
VDSPLRLRNAEYGTKGNNSTFQIKLGFLLPNFKNQFMKTKNEIMVKPYSTEELSKLYGICVKTFKKWTLPIEEKVGVKNGRFYTVTQTEKIFKHLGLPFQVDAQKFNINLNKN